MLLGTSIRGYMRASYVLKIISLLNTFNVFFHIYFISLSRGNDLLGKPRGGGGGQHFDK